MNINLSVERLILHDLPLSATQLGLMRAALEDELGRLILDGGLAPALLAGGALATIPAAPLVVTAGSDAAATGRGIAQTVYRALAAGAGGTP